MRYAYHERRGGLTAATFAHKIQSTYRARPSPRKGHPTMIENVDRIICTMRYYLEVVKPELDKTFVPHSVRTNGREVRVSIAEWALYGPRKVIDNGNT